MPFCKKGSKTDCSNYIGISGLSTIYRIVSSILLSRSKPYAEEITVCLCCGIQCNRSTADHILCIQVLDKKWQYTEAVHQLFIDFKKSLIKLRWRSCILLPLSVISP